MQINTSKMRDNVWLHGGTFFSQGVLLALIKKDMTREDAYTIVQECAHEAEENFKYKIMMKNIFEPDELNKIFDLTQYTKHVEYIYNKVL